MEYGGTSGRPQGKNTFSTLLSKAEGPAVSTGSLGATSFPRGRFPVGGGQMLGAVTRRHQRPGEGTWGDIVCPIPPNSVFWASGRGTAPRPGSAFPSWNRLVAPRLPDFPAALRARGENPGFPCRWERRCPSLAPGRRGPHRRWAFTSLEPTLGPPSAASQDQRAISLRPHPSF